MLLNEPCAAKADLVPLLKRIVLKHPDGLHQILGTCTEQPESFLQLLKTTIDGEPVAINLVAAHPRFYLFTIVQRAAGLGEFHSEQR